MASIIETLTTLHTEEFTGKVILKKDPVTKTIFFRKGVPVLVDSNVRSETLGQLLLGQAKITEDQYRAVLDQMEKTGKRQGEVLVELGYLSAFEVYEALRSQAHVKFENAFMLEGAEVVAEKGDQHLAGIMETPVDFFRTYLNFFEDWVTEAAPAKYPEKKALRLTQRGREYLSGRALQGRELKTVRLLDGRRTISQVLEVHSGEEVSAFAVIEALNAMSFIDFDDPLPARFQRSKAEVTAEKALPIQESTTPGARLVDLTEPAPQRKASPLYDLALNLDQPYPKLLRLPAHANRFQVKKAFDDLVRAYHLDAISETYQGDEKRLAEAALDRLSLALTVLSDENRRNEYLQGLGRKDSPRDPSPKVKAEAALQKAHLFSARKRFEEAELEIRKAVEMDPQEGSYHVDLAQLFMARAAANKDPLPDVIENEIRIALKLNASDPRAYFELGVYLKLKNELDRARTAFLKVLELKPSDEKSNAELRLIMKRLESHHRSEPFLRGLFKKKK
ncbi:MAG: DUF4388 domain-containing protein [Pseudomonadota bacterium]